MRDIDPEKLIDGKAVADRILADISAEIGSFSAGNRSPRLSVIIVGEDPASQVYVGMKVKKAAACGIDSDLIEMPGDVLEEHLLGRIDRLNSDADIDGILVQMPLPEHIDRQKVIERISPKKDVDGIHPYNLGRLAADKPLFISCTPFGITILLSEYGVATEGKHVVVVGRSLIVGKPMALLLTSKTKTGNATVTICHSKSDNLGAVTVMADILIAAVGIPEMIKGSMVKDGVVVIDVGSSRVEDPASKKGYRIAGDVDFDSVYPKASLITPVPGGVGPMTVAILMKNTLQAARLARGERDEQR